MSHEQLLRMIKLGTVLERKLYIDKLRKIDLLLKSHKIGEKNPKEELFVKKLRDELFRGDGDFGLEEQ